LRITFKMILIKSILLRVKTPGPDRDATRIPRRPSKRDDPGTIPIDATREPSKGDDNQRRYKRTKQEN
jgi:hypothetical protein